MNRAPPTGAAAEPARLVPGHRPPRAASRPAPPTVLGSLPHRRTPASTPRRAGLVLGVGALLVAAGCTPPTESQGGRAPVLYVANGLDGTVSRLDTGSGRAAGAPLPAGPAPWRMVPGPNGSVLVQPTVLGLRGELRLVTRVAGAWTTRPVALAAGASQVVLAGDGGRYALVAYHVPAGAGAAVPRCRLALVDLLSGRIEGMGTVCTDRERVVGLALAEGPTGDPGTQARSAGGPLVAYLAIWQPPAGAAAADRPTSAGRIVALDVTTGALLAATPVDGVPGRLALVRGAGLAAPRLLAAAADLVVDPLSVEESYNDYLQRASGGTVASLDTVTLSLEREVRVRPPVRALAVTPGGRDAYALGGQGQLTYLDLASGQVRRLAALPGGELGLDLAVTADHLYVPDSQGERVWALDRQTGRVRAALPTGRHPIGLAVG